MQGSNPDEFEIFYWKENFNSSPIRNRYWNPGTELILLLIRMSEDLNNLLISRQTMIIENSDVFHN
jgi:hypothetical protein